MQPARAELVPDIAVPLDVRKLRLRVWNLGSGNDAVTWNLDEVRVFGARPLDSPGPAAGAIVVPNVSGVTIAPGAMWESPAFSITLTEQSSLTYASHTLVSLKGTMGTMNKTPLTVVVPIPSALALVKQTTTAAQTASVMNNPMACCGTMACSACGENAELRQPFSQKVTGTLAHLATHHDVLGAQADAEVAKAQDDDARIAGVALLAWPAIAQRYFQPTLPMMSKLTVSSPLFECPTQYYCVRKADAGDAPDPDDISFTVDFDAHDYIAAAAAGAVGATQSVYLTVWTNSGAAFSQNVVLWPIRSANTAAMEITNEGNCGKGMRNVGFEMSGGCLSTASMPQCGQGMFTAWTRSILFGPLRGLGASINDKDFFAIAGWPKIAKLGDMAAPSSSSVSCTTMTSGGNYDLTCFSDENSFVLKQVQMTGSGACPQFPPKPGVPFTAQYSAIWEPATRDFFQKAYGRSDLPAWTIDLN
jgi:hypothetical protein